MGKWKRVAVPVVSGVSSIVFIVQAIRWAVGDEGVVRIAGLEFDERLLVDFYVVVALISGSVPMVLLARFLLPPLTEKLRPNPHRFGDLLEEIRHVREAIGRYPDPDLGESETYERVRRIHRKLAALEIAAPSMETTAYIWERFLARLCVLAEQRQYKEAKTLWEEMDAVLFWDHRVPNDYEP